MFFISTIEITGSLWSYITHLVKQIIRHHVQCKQFLQECTLHLIFLSNHASSHPSNNSSNASQFSLIITNLRSKDQQSALEKNNVDDESLFFCWCIARWMGLLQNLSVSLQIMHTTFHWAQFVLFRDICNNLEEPWDTNATNM